MRCFFVFCIFCVGFSSSTFSQIIINEIYYDHPGRDDGYEFIELINTGDFDLALAGSTLEFHDGNSGGWRVVWTWGAGDTIASGSLVVVGGEEVWNWPDYVVELGLQNGPDAVRLVVEGTEADRVGYGVLSGTQYYEGESAPDVSEGQSLARYPDGRDTQDNAQDFRVMEPSPGSFNRPRKNVALTRGSSLRRVVDDGGGDEIRVFVVNRGVTPVDANAVTVEMQDSTELGIGSIQSTANDHVIAVGDSTELVFWNVFLFGYHAVRLTARLDGDERSTDDTVEFFRRAGHPPLLVSEIMSHPSASCPEYIEVYNAGTDPYRLVDHYVRDAAHDPTPVGDLSDHNMIPPGGYLVLTGDKKGLLACFAGADSNRVVDIQGSWPSLNHSGSIESDSVVVLDQYLLPVDRIAYPPQDADTRGRSLERVDLYPGTRTHVWLLSAEGGGGSPGRGHDRAIVVPGHEVAVSVRPNPFDPTGGDVLLITVAGQPEATQARVQIFDIDGRTTRDIGSSEALPFVFVWDGTDDAGRVVVSGIYILVCEFFGLATGSHWVERVVLGCGRKNH